MKPYNYYKTSRVYKDKLTANPTTRLQAVQNMIYFYTIAKSRFYSPNACTAAHNQYCSLREALN